MSIFGGFQFLKDPLLILIITCTVLTTAKILTRPATRAQLHQLISDHIVTDIVPITTDRCRSYYHIPEFKIE